jgi:drug/metabolite transporter (DMT)-like permease
MQNSRLSRLLPYLALVVGILALGISPFFVRWSKAPGPVTAFYRICIATLVLAPFFIRSLIREPMRWSRKALLYPILGGLSTSADLTVWSISILYTRVANATLLGNTSPIWVALVAWLIFREPMKKAFWAGLALAMTGAVVVVGGDILTHPSLSIGDLLGLGSGFFYAGYFLAAQRGRQYLDTIRYIWIMDLVAGLGLFGFIIAAGMPLTGFDQTTYLAFLGSGLITQVIGYFAVIYALGHLPASLVSPTLIGQPVLAAILAIPLMGEHLTPTQWIGGLAVLAGIYIIHRVREVKPQQPEPVIVEALPLASIQ